MKINKKLINQILSKKIIYLRDFLKDFNYIIKKEDGKLSFYSFNSKKFFELEDIIYTIYFLKKRRFD
ncbi:MAG TPA: hypothetical protein VJ926_02215 [Patescibacteria group bacterium]|nr:hypothetical protein [Patescibacteria group bacterium]